MIYCTFILPILIPIIFILLTNWCALKKEEYPEIKIEKKKYLKTYLIIYTISLISNMIFSYFRSNIYESIVFNIVLSLLVPLSYIDWKTSLIPNRISSALFIIGICTVSHNYFNQNNYLFYTYNEQIISFVIMSISFLILYFISRGGVGMGDVKLISSLALLFNVNGITLTLFISSFFVIVYNTIVSIIYKKRISELPNNEIKLSDVEEKIEGRILGISIINGRPSITMGPFISIAFVITAIFSNMFFTWLWG